MDGLLTSCIILPAAEPSGSNIEIGLRSMYQSPDAIADVLGKSSIISAVTTVEDVTVRITA